MGDNKLTSVPDVILLIQEIRKTAPCVWNSNDPNYNNRFHVGLVWKKIAKKMAKNEHVLRVKWKNLKDTFKKELKKYPCDDLEGYKGKWLYFEHLYFLREHNKNYKDIEIYVEENSENNDDENEGNDDESDDDNDDGNRTNGISIVSIKQEYEDFDKDDDGNSNYDEDREDPIRSVAKRKRPNEKPKEISFVSVNPKRENNSSSSLILSKEYEYDEMFLKSLTPFFNKLDPMRKLVVRGRIQDMLMSELAAQGQTSKK